MYHMHEELAALREVHAELKKRYAKDMADAALSMLELRQKYDKYIEWITEKVKQLKQAPPEKVFIRNAFGLPIHQDPRLGWEHKRCEVRRQGTSAQARSSVETLNPKP